LNLPGIFRESASSSAVETVIHTIEQGDEINWSDFLDPHLPPNILKRFFRDLVNPIMTQDAYGCFLQVEFHRSKKIFFFFGIFFFATDLFSDDQYLDRLRNVFSLLPKAHIPVAKFLLNFLHRVALAQETNKEGVMGVRNLATVWAPVLFTRGNAGRRAPSLAPQGQQSLSNTGALLDEAQEKVKEMGMVIEVTAYLIERADEVFAEGIESMMAMTTEAEGGEMGKMPVLEGVSAVEPQGVAEETKVGQFFFFLIC
jgi:hypothetical protein